MKRLKNRLVARVLTRFPGLFERSVEKVEGAVEAGEVPWTPLDKPLAECTLAVVTTAGVHLRSQEPFDMEDPDGDATFRELPTDTPRDDYTITHDYYDHADADRDINIVLPVDRLGELAASGRIKGTAPFNYSFMGHIDGAHLERLREETAPEVARRLADSGVDVAILTPG